MHSQSSAGALYIREFEWHRNIQVAPVGNQTPRRLAFTAVLTVRRLRHYIRNASNRAPEKIITYDQSKIKAPRPGVGLTCEVSCLVRRQLVV